jgi:hypothetical protein
MCSKSYKNTPEEALRKLRMSRMFRDNTAGKSVRHASLIGLASPRRGWLRRGTRRKWLKREIAKADAQLTRRKWLKREIAKADAQLKSIEDHIRAQQARIAERSGSVAETADALAFLETLQDCQRAHETHLLHLVRELDAT